MKAKNHVIYGDDETLRRLRDDYRFIGRDCEIQGDRLVIFALPPKKAKRKDDKRGAKRGR